MWPAALTRLIRRRFIFIVIIIIALIYIFGQVFDRHGAYHAVHYDAQPIQRTRPLLWQQLLPVEQHYNHSPDELSSCRNTVQGAHLMTDERGFVCRREQLLGNGCCNVELAEVSYYSCKSCNETTHCCGIYEYCVSCCLHPNKQPMLQVLLDAPTNQKHLYASVIDQFELCLVKCRTNSHSVEHENKYRNELAKYCYGLTHAHESQLKVAQE